MVGAVIQTPRPRAEQQNPFTFCSLEQESMAGEKPVLEWNRDLQAAAGFVPSMVFPALRAEA